MELRKLAELRVAIFELGSRRTNETNTHFINDILIDARCSIGRRRPSGIVADKPLSKSRSIMSRVFNRS